MCHSDVYEICKKKLNFEHKDIDMWFPNGFNSVRIRFKNKEEIVYTHTNDKKWRIESIEQYIEFLESKREKQK